MTEIKLSAPSSGKLPFVKLCDGSGGLSSVATGKAGGLVTGEHGQRCGRQVRPVRLREPEGSQLAQDW
ncbi:MAG TPA: hypothetical protein VFZ32_00925 [Micromonosporaceae bacterium]